MKFGKNLQHLSIPEWKCYNIDYNELKSQIRDVTLDETAADLSPLYQSFVSNFEYVNLFSSTKLGELSRKMRYLSEVFSSKQAYATDARLLLYDADEIFTQSIELSITLKNLSKFIIIQKIALKKLFKKLLKYYPDTKGSSKFIVSLKNNLVNNRGSFINVDLSTVTNELTAFINRVKQTQTALLDDIHRKRTSITASMSNRSDVVSTVGTVGTTGTSNVSLEDSSNPRNNHVLFDLNVVLKKNFHLNLLLPNDSNNLSDLVLNLNVYLNLNTNSDSSSLAFTFLAAPKSDPKYPSYIISNDDDSTSTLVVHTGGLRNYTYCTLPNSLVSLLLQFLVDETKETEFLAELDLSGVADSKLTGITLSTIFSDSLKPVFKLFCKRARFILKHNDEIITDDSDANLLSRSPLSGQSTNASALNMSALTSYQDDFLITLDYDIHTTDNRAIVCSLDSYYSLPNKDVVESFPHNHLAFHSNDSNLSNFVGSLNTEVSDYLVHSTYDLSLLRRLPQKLQDLISKSTAVTLYKGLSFYQYMQSCYLNIIPEIPINHYSKILELNLLKKFECIESFNNQMNLEQSLIKAKSQSILKRQLSLKSLNTYPDLQPDLSPLLVKQNSTVSVASTKYSLASALSNHDERGEDESVVHGQHNYDLLHFGTEENSNEDDDYLALYINMQQKYDDSVSSEFALTILQLQKRMSRKFKSFFKHFKNKSPFRSKEHSPLLPVYSSSGAGYDSMYEEAPKFLDRNSLTNIHNQYEHEYNQTLSYIYFSLKLISIFLSGLELGIIYSIFRNLESTDSRLLINDNVWLILILIIGMLLSLVFSMMSISLIYSRYNSTPVFHSCLIWGGFSIVCVCCFSSMAILLQGM